MGVKTGSQERNFWYNRLNLFSISPFSSGFNGISMIKAEFICTCGFIFEESLHENEVSRTEDFERFYVRCPRCGEEASLRSWERVPENSPRRKTDVS